MIQRLKIRRSGFTDDDFLLSGWPFSLKFSIKRNNVVARTSSKRVGF